MKLNKVLDYYNRAYYKAAAGAERGRSAVNALKKAVNAGARPAYYRTLKKRLMKVLSGPLYWPNTYPTSIDAPTGELLYSVVRLSRPEVAVEIGTAKGNSAMYIAQGLQDNGRGILYTIDPFEQEIFRIAIKKSGLKHRIQYIIDYSTNAFKEPEWKKIDFAFIDGNHDRESVRADFELVKPFLSPGSIVAFHDTLVDETMGDFDGPKKVVEEIRASGQYEVITLPTEIGVGENKELVLAGISTGNFRPVGVTICKKI